MNADQLSIRGYLQQFNDIAKADRFTVMIPAPSGLTGYSQATQGLAFQCEVSELPGRTLETFSARSYGPEYRYPRQPSYGDLNLTFFCMANRGGSPNTGIWEKMFFDDWMELINPSLQSTSNAPWNFEYLDSYATNFTVTHYDVYDKPTYSVKFNQAYPIAITPMTLSWNDDSQLKLTVVFCYRSWQRTSSVNAPTGLSDNISTDPTGQFATDLSQSIDNSFTIPSISF